jgi:hypothetical protein
MIKGFAADRIRACFEGQEQILMTTTTIEAKTTATFPDARSADERAVFVTEDDSRSRRLRHAAIALGTLTCLWFAGLGIGTLGLGRLPGVSLSIPGAGGKQRSHGANPRGDAARTRATATPQLAQSKEPTTQTMQPATAIQFASSRTRQDRTTPTGAPAPVSHVPALAPATPSQAAQPATHPVPRGLARRELTAPPGQTNRETRPQQPAAAPGQARRVEDSTATTEPLPPGQQLDKPPPKG